MDINCSSCFSRRRLLLYLSLALSLPPGCSSTTSSFSFSACRQSDRAPFCPVNSLHSLSLLLCVFGRTFLLTGTKVIRFKLTIASTQLARFTFQCKCIDKASGEQKQTALIELLSCLSPSVFGFCFLAINIICVGTKVALEVGTLT